MKVKMLLVSSVIGGAILVSAVSEGQVILSVFCLLLLGLALLSKKDVNSQFLVLSFLSIFALEKVIFYPIMEYVFPSNSPFFNNSLAFSIQLITSLLLIYLVKNRMQLSLIFTKGKSPSVLEKNYTEGPLYGLVIGYALVNLFALVENFIRNLELIGVSDELAKKFWEVTFFYDNFEIMKAILISLTIAVLYMGVIIRKRQSLSAA